MGPGLCKAGSHRCAVQQARGPAAGYERVVYLQVSSCTRGRRLPPEGGQDNRRVRLLKATRLLRGQAARAPLRRRMKRRGGVSEGELRNHARGSAANCGREKQPRRTLRSSRSLICRFPRVPRNNARSLAIPSCSGSWRVPRDAPRPLKRPVGAFCTLGPSGLYVHYIRTKSACQEGGHGPGCRRNPYCVLASPVREHAMIRPRNSPTPHARRRG